MTGVEKDILLRLVGVWMLLMGCVFNMSGDINMEYHADIVGQASSRSLAPYMLGSWNQGRFVAGNGLWQEAGFFKRLDLDRRFDWSVGFDYIAGVMEKTDYARWDEANQTWGISNAHRNAFRIQQLFGEIKYRAAYLTVGMKDYASLIVDDRLSSGDLTRSNNATAIPGIGAGFLDFVDIPFTKGWVQINGEIMYGKMLDSGFKRDEFNYFQGSLSQDLWYNYKRCYFRTDPDQPFFVTVGMQAAGMFAGSTVTYRNGKVFNTERRGLRFKDVVQMFFPIQGGEDYYTGNHLGTWSLRADYALRGGSRLAAYFQWPWEDGSGIGRMNGWDGLWGLEFTFPKKGILSKAVVEYLDFTNQSGPIHFDPEDKPFNPISGHAQGADDYYNNSYYGAYANYGMSIGTPFLMSPVYNLNGSLQYLHNRARGFHVALEGNPAAWITYRIMAGYQLAGGYGYMPAFHRQHATSGMIDVKARVCPGLPQLEVGLSVAFDKGQLRGDNFGARLQLSYKGLFNLNRH